MKQVAQKPTLKDKWFSEFILREAIGKNLKQRNKFSRYISMPTDSFLKMAKDIDLSNKREGVVLQVDPELISFYSANSKFQRRLQDSRV